MRVLVVLSVLVSVLAASAAHAQTNPVVAPPAASAPLTPLPAPPPLQAVPASTPPPTPLPAPQPPTSAAGGDPAPSTTPIPLRPHEGTWRPLKPGVSLSANADGSNTVRASLTAEEDWVRRWYADGRWPAVWGFSYAPTLSATDNTKKGLFSIAPSASTVNTGLTSISGGFLFAATRYASLRDDETRGLFEALAQAKLPPPTPTPAEIQACDELCASRASDPTDNCQKYRKNHDLLVSSFQARKHLSPTPSEIAQELDRSVLCTPVQQDVEARFDAFLKDNPKIQASYKQQMLRARFPVLDMSIWSGGGLTQFAYFDLQTAAVGAALPAYASTSKWFGNGGAAVEVVALPWIDGQTPHGWTFEATSYVKAAYQGSKATGMGCTGALGTVSSDKFPSSSFLGQCDASQPIGHPGFGGDLLVEGYAGWADIDHEYGRIAFGGGIDRNFVASITTWSVKIPIYLNGTAPAKEGSAPKTSADGIIALSYDGIVRLTPTLSYASDPTGKSTGWSAGVSVDLIGNHNLFTRADTLVK